ncbi:uncharacterized protein PADG_12472 [Paracoccidioides brasiliensis Pb18]|uniref:Uncharacterized protein n=1 Tax=Paracoccidioides brasiliensis (strain Pb18) TaxID=502780 RepID=A0A0A0HTW6_PARBD|nr:uncharacterized protein PADG_12472 [Paracoccidioides brasiliensis Pb18]KGM91451.1 hypothetical protein PADG_12472 [Paracoccidioides brasiliensis Pb18]
MQLLISRLVLLSKIAWKNGRIWFVNAARRRSDMEEQGEDEKKAFLHIPDSLKIKQIPDLGALLQNPAGPFGIDSHVLLNQDLLGIHNSPILRRHAIDAGQ